jgi:PAS domain S-box-containing protein
MQSNATIIDFIYNSKIAFSEKKYEKLRNDSNELLVPPLKIMALLIAISGLFAMIFEVRYFSEYSIQVYFTRLSATIIAFLILVLLHNQSVAKKPVVLVHTLLVTIIASSGYMIYLLPTTLIINSQIVGLMIFTSALFLSWDIKNQIVVAIYYNVVFASAILLNDKSIYFLPNMYESLLFVLFLSIISVIGSAANFRLRMLLAEKSHNVMLSEKKFRSIFDNSAEGLFQSSPEGQFITVNKALVNMLGYENEEELLAINIKKDLYKYPEERGRLLKELKEKGEVLNTRVTLKKKDGSEIIVRLNDRLVNDQEENTFFFEGNMRDITEKVKAEEERDKAETELKEEKLKSDRLAKEATKSSVIKSQFLANMSHEIRTPLNGIIGYLSLIDMGACEDKNEMKQFISNAKESAESLLEIINDILDLSKIEAGKIELADINLNINEIINDSISIVQSKVKEKGLEIIKEVSNDIPLGLKGDPTRIRQIFLNLLSNAIKFTERGYVKVSVFNKSIEGETITIGASVEDTGIGIPSDKVGLLFKPFSQLDGSTTKKYGGTGLGLVICKEFVSIMGGDIGVESTFGNGSKFYFTVKLRIQPNLKKTKKNNSPSISHQLHDSTNSIKDIKSFELKSERQKYKLLLAEDNLINQKVAIKILNDAGYFADVVPDGKQAVDAVKEKDYNLVLMDIQMPEMDGFSATGEIRKLEGDKSTIPIIAITAHALIGDKERCLDAGMNDYITKPIIAAKLISAIDTLLNINLPVEKQESKLQVNPDGIFDFSHLEKVSMGDDNFQKEILSTYMEDVNIRFQKLQTHISNNDLSKIVNEAHTIKGASYSIGARKIGDEALAIELSGKHEDLQGANERVKKLEEALSETKEILKDLLEPVQISKPS